MKLRMDVGQILPVSGPYWHDGGHCYVAKVPGLTVDDSDRIGSPSGSQWTLYENGRALGPAHWPHDFIRRDGGGAFSVWNGQLYFSTSDNSVPGNHSPSYELRRDPAYYFAQHARRVSNIVKGWLRVLPKERASLVGCVVMEVGPGPELGTLALLAALGASHVVACDPVSSPWRADWHPHLFRSLAIEAEKLGLPVQSSILHRAAEEGLGAVGVTWTEHGIEDLPSEWRRSVDIMVSHAVLEHFRHPDQAFSMMAAACRPGAFGVHDVDFRDHASFAQPLEFLMEEDHVWDASTATVFERGNRLRLAETLERLAANGFLVHQSTVTQIADKPYMEDLIPRLRVSGSRYADMDEEYLQDLSATLVLERV